MSKVYNLKPAVFVVVSRTMRTAPQEPYEEFLVGFVGFRHPCGVVFILTLLITICIIK